MNVYIYVNGKMEKMRTHYESLRFLVCFLHLAISFSPHSPSRFSICVSLLTYTPLTLQKSMYSDSHALLEQRSAQSTDEELYKHILAS